MKMKKTIAAVMAAMTAVSAMAATVSADQEEINLHYDLRTKVTTYEPGNALFTQRFTPAQGSQAATQDMYVANPGAAKTSSGTYVPVLRFGADFLTQYGVDFDKMLEAVITFNITPKNTAGTGTTTATHAITLSAKFTTDADKAAADPEWIYVGSKDDGFADVGAGLGTLQVFNNATGQVQIPVNLGATLPATAQADIDGDNVLDQVVNLANPTANYFNLSSFDLVDYGYTAGVDYTPVLGNNINPIIDGVGLDFGFSSVNVNITYELKNYWYDGPMDTQYVGWDFGWGEGGSTPEELAWLGINPYGEKTADSKFVKERTLPQPNSLMQQNNSFIDGLFSGSVSKAGEKKEHIYPLLSTSSVYTYYPTRVEPYFIDGQLVWAPDSWTRYFVNNGTGNNGWTAQYVQVDSTDRALRTNDVIAAIRRSKSGTSPLSVINDAIANDYDVEFTFTSASGYVATMNTAAVHNWLNPHEEITYPVINAWNKATFGQHLYSSSYSNVSSPYSGASFEPAYSLSANAATDMYGSFSSAWAQNLVTAGLVVNSELTMQLNDVQKLQWDANQLTFHWDDVIDGKVTRVNQVLTTMLLYTPVDWYWDTLDVKVLKTEDVEDVNAGESLEEEGEELEEEVVEEEVFEEEPEEEVEEEEPEEEIEVEVEEVPVEEEPVEVVAPVAESPKTGNAPIALAVIPVALAAAAVVAKKRG